MQGHILYFVLEAYQYKPARYDGSGTHPLQPYFRSTYTRTC